MVEYSLKICGRRLKKVFWSFIVLVLDLNLNLQDIKEWKIFEKFQNLQTEPEVTNQM